LPGRLLFLSDDPRKIDAQLAGRTLTLAQAAPMRDDVSTSCGSATRRARIARADDG